MPRNRSHLAALILVLAGPAAAQDKGTLDPKPLPPIAHPEDPATPAKELFGRKSGPASLEARSIGFYAHGCLAGAQALPVNGEAWQVMRLSRNRNWGNPALIGFLERFAKKVPKINGWPGILVGDMSQPRGGPMLTGHASHQIGLDADIWLTPDAGPQPLARRTRGNVGDQRRARRWARREQALDAGPHGGDQGGGAGPRRAAHLCECGDQEGNLPRGQGRPVMARESAPDVWAQLPFPCPHASARKATRLAKIRRRCQAARAAIRPRWPIGSRDRVLHPKRDPNAKPRPA